MICVVTKYTKIYDGCEYEIYKNEKGVKYRTDGPALKYISGYLQGTEYWYYNNLFHRVGGPAVTYCDTYPYNELKNEWKKMNVLHRLNAPAVLYKNGNKKYYEFGIIMS